MEPGGEPMEIDTAQAGRFLTALGGDADHTFQTFSESGRGGRAVNRILHGTFSRRASALVSLNQKGAGAFVMVNAGNGVGRRSDNVISARALFVDLDGAPVEPVLSGPLAPRIVVESSPGKWHCYWPIVDLPLDRFTDAQKALAARFDGDPKVHDRARVMRLPGFLHNKAAPFQTRLVTCEGSPYTWHEMVEAFGLRDRMRLPDVIREGGRNQELFKLAASAAASGVPQAAQLTKALQVNASTCQPPLDAYEVAQIVASAYRGPVQGVAAIPLAVVDSDDYKALRPPERELLLHAYRRGRAGGPFSLPHGELQAWFPRKNTFNAIRRRLVASGLLILAVPPIKKQPRKGIEGKCGLYRIGAFSAAHQSTPIGALSATPELLQVSGSRASKAVSCENGHPETGRRAA